MTGRNFENWSEFEAVQTQARDRLNSEAAQLLEQGYDYSSMFVNAIFVGPAPHMSELKYLSMQAQLNRALAATPAMHESLSLEMDEDANRRRAQDEPKDRPNAA